jgi:hypothetical protein
MFSSFFTMSPFKQQAFGVGMRLFKSLATSTVALSAVAGGLALTGQEAKAFNISFNGGLLGPDAFPGGVATYGMQWTGGGPGLLANPGPVPPAINKPYTKQWYDTNFQGTRTQPGFYFYPTDKRIWFVDKNTLVNNPITSGMGGPSTGSGDVEWTWQDVNNNGDWRIPTPDPHSVDEWHVDVDFGPDLDGADGTSQFDYVIRIENRSIDYPGEVPPPLPGNLFFEDVTLSGAIKTDITPGPISGVVTKEIYEAVWNATLGDYTPGTLISTLMIDRNTAQDNYTFLGSQKYDRLYIRDIANANDDMIDNYANIYRQVPGPLPILGAGAALGFSRKLRGRIKASRCA